jgi:ATP-binding cassette subfamily C protein
VFVISPFIGWIVAAGLALLTLINVLNFHLAKAREERHSEAKEGIGGLKEVLIASRHVLETQQMTAAYNKRWVRARRRSRDAAVEYKDFSGWFSTLSSHTTLLLQYVALAAAAYLTIQGELTIGSMVAAMVLTRHVANATERFVKQIPSIREARESWANLDRILKTPRLPTATPETAPALHISQVSVRCPLTKNKLLRNLNLEVSPGSSIEIVGGAGSGKTILAETLIGRFPRTAGKVLLGTIDIERLSIADAGKTFGYVPQAVDFLAGTIEENIAGLDTEPDRSRLVHVARLAQIHDKIVSLPDGYLTRIDALGSLFSKSERHALALARALYPDPNLLIVDEPDTSFRDGLTKGLKNEIGSFLARGGILILLTRVALKSYRASRTLTLDGGSLKEIAPSRSQGKVIKGPEWVGAR